MSEHPTQRIPVQPLEVRPPQFDHRGKRRGPSDEGRPFLVVLYCLSLLALLMVIAACAVSINRDLRTPEPTIYLCTAKRGCEQAQLR